MSSGLQIRITRQSSAYWTAVFDHPPINLIDRNTVAELDKLVAELETDPDVRVIVFESADPDYFLAHYDVFDAKSAPVGEMPPTRTGLNPWLDVLVRLSRIPAVSIASIRGCARGAGSEFALACDIRFASAEKAVLGQFEVGVGAVPGGGPMARLPGLTGRGRTLEVVLGADDFPGPLAERYGYVNRAIPDGELDAFVRSFAERLASFDKATIAETKAFVDEATLPDDQALSRALQAFYRSVARPAARERISTLLHQGLQTRSDLERRLGRHVALLRGENATRDPHAKEQ
jgi:enoyl-CoA hydratase/carnithine racemase